MDKSELARPRDAASHIRALEARIGELERTAFRKRRCPHCGGEFQLIADVDEMLSDARQASENGK